MPILIGLLALLAGILGFAATKPDEFSMRRSTRIRAPQDRIFAHLDDFHRWEAWSPWENIDPALKRTYSGPSSGPGAAYEWAGNSKVGSGRMEITDTSSPSQVTIKLDFLKPFEAHNTAQFKLEPVGSETDVTWMMRGPSTFQSKVFSVFVNMDKLLGKDFEKGLARLKEISEA